MSEQLVSAISVNLSEGSFTISGSESFVESNREIILDFVEKNVTMIKRKSQPTSIVTENQQEENTTSPVFTGKEKEPDKPEVDKYVKAGIYHVDSEDGTISILKKIPGNNNAEKIKNIALIVLYIKKEKVSGSSIRPLCEKHSCYDMKNFAAIFRKEKTNFIKKGKGQSWTIELTLPGEDAAVDLLEEMMANAAI